MLHVQIQQHFALSRFDNTRTQFASSAMYLQCTAVPPLFFTFLSQRSRHTLLNVFEHENIWKRRVGRALCPVPFWMRTAQQWNGIECAMRSVHGIIANERHSSCENAVKCQKFTAKHHSVARFHVIILIRNAQLQSKNICNISQNNDDISEYGISQEFWRNVELGWGCALSADTLFLFSRLLFRFVAHSADAYIQFYSIHITQLCHGEQAPSFDAPKYPAAHDAERFNQIPVVLNQEHSSNSLSHTLTQRAAKALHSTWNGHGRGVTMILPLVLVFVGRCRRCRRCGNKRAR